MQKRCLLLVLSVEKAKSRREQDTKHYKNGDRQSVRGWKRNSKK